MQADFPKHHSFKKQGREKKPISWLLKPIHCDILNVYLGKKLKTYAGYLCYFSSAETSSLFEAACYTQYF